MLTVALIILWNAFILFGILGSVVYVVLERYGMSFTHLALAEISLAMVITVALLAMSPIGEFILRIPLAIRKPTQRESSRLDPLLYEVTKAISLKMGKQISYVYYMTDKKKLSSAALGRKTIILSRGLLNTASDEELKAVIAHELSHLYYRDSMVLAMALGANLCSSTIRICLEPISTVLINLGYRARRTSFIYLILGFIGRLLGYVLKGMGLVSRLALESRNRRRTFHADGFSKRLGFLQPMLSYLEKLSEEEDHEDGFWNKFMERRPATMLRIDRLEKMTH